MNTSQKLNEIRQYVGSVMASAPKMNACGVNFPVLGHSDGDACLFNGLLASVGSPSGRHGVMFSQAQGGEPWPGMFYRSPRRRSWGTDLRGEKAFFSRDMALGVLCMYAVAPPANPWSADSARKWLNWIDGSRPCAVKKPWPFKGCMIRGLHKFAPDDRSKITPAMWAMMGRVWKHHNWPKHDMMIRCDKADGDESVYSARTVELGYQLHLKVVQAYIKLLIGQSREYSQKVGQIAHGRIPQNLFYEFVARRKITEEMIDDFLDMRPPLDQKWGNSWIWEKSEVTDERIAKSCGWDWVFMGKLISRYA